MITEFVVKTADNKDRLAQCTFATLPDLDKIPLWRRQVKGASDEVTQDALEFAKLSSKRWLFYHEQGLTAASVSTLKHMISTEKNIELAFLCVARAKWAGPHILGIALARRTWCGHLILDFLATQPLRLVDGPDRIKGIGKGMLYGIAEVASAVGAKVLWGEATKASAPKYQSIFGLKKVDDLLYVQGGNLNGFRTAMHEQLKRSGLLSK